MLTLGVNKNTGKDIHIDLDRLIETRLLIQANSGGGKSYLLRKLLELTHGKCQQIVLDPEGEFASLREKFDYVLAGKGGDIPASPLSADLLARKILELKTSLIVDLYELKQHERTRYVQLFLESLVNAPKHLWHPVLVVVDEAHIYAPEGSPSGASSAMIDLATRGRKRGFCLVAATQRLAILNKNVAAQCQNKLIGLAGLDIDMKRAGEELGFTSKEEIRALRDLDPGDFYAFGPALTREIAKIKVGKVKTHHPESGKRIATHVPTPTAKVKSILTQLTDLPKEAEEELRDRRELQTRVKELERELKKQPAPALDEARLAKEIQKAITQTRSEVVQQLKQAVSDLQTGVQESLEGFEASLKALKTSPVEVPKSSYSRAMDAFVSNPPPTRYVPSRADDEKTRVPAETDTAGKIGKCERMVLSFLALQPQQGFTKVQIGAITGYSHTSGGFNNSLSKLKQMSLISGVGDRIQLNREVFDGIRESQGFEPVPIDPRRALEDWLARLGKCERVVYEVLVKNPRDTYTKDELGQMTNYSATSGGFNNSLSHLNTLGLAKKDGSGRIGLNPEIRDL
jgi:hypothetical protein